jgi:hypothetical protein
MVYMYVVYDCMICLSNFEVKQKYILTDQNFLLPLCTSVCNAFTIQIVIMYLTLIFQMARDFKIFMYITVGLYLVIPQRNNDRHVFLTSSSNLAS